MVNKVVFNFIDDDTTRGRFVYCPECEKLMLIGDYSVHCGFCDFDGLEFLDGEPMYASANELKERGFIVKEGF